MFYSNKDGRLQLGVYYRRLNRVINTDSYTFMILEDCLYSLGNTYVLSTHHVIEGYWNIPFGEEDRGKTTFKSHTG